MLLPHYILQAAYLVGIADKASEPGRPGLVDQTEFHRAHQAIQNACMNLTNPTTTQQQVMTRGLYRKRAAFSGLGSFACPQVLKKYLF